MSFLLHKAAEAGFARELKSIVGKDWNNPPHKYLSVLMDAASFPKTIEIFRFQCTEEDPLCSSSNCRTNAEKGAF